MRHDSEVSTADNLLFQAKPAAIGGSVRILDCGHDPETEQSLLSARFADRSSRDDARTSAPTGETPSTSQLQVPNHDSLGEQCQAL